MSDITVTYFAGQGYTMIASPRGHTTLTMEMRQRWQASQLAHLLGATFEEVL